MKELYDFIVNALPWIAIGLFVAFSCVRADAIKKEKKLGRAFDAATWSPAICFLVLGILEMSSGKTSTGTTWLVLAVFNTVVNFVNKQNSEE